MTAPKAGEIWKRKKAHSDELKEVKVVAVDNRYVHIKDKNGVFQVLKEVWHEHFEKVAERSNH